jgi:exo-beta-1,3-glucanase (GH17 family)/putative component of membrane protein insertase Oxa1/YidC/SpoIIIJ protein YidD
VKAIAILLIELYQRFLSPYKGYRCAHAAYHRGPSCSAAVKEILCRHGVLVGLPLVRRRFVECHAASRLIPWVTASTFGLAGCGPGPTPVTPTPTSIFDQPVPAPQFTVNKKIFGLDVGPFVLHGQDPNLGTNVPADQLNYLIDDAVQYAGWIHTFGTSGTLQNAGLDIHLAGAKAMIGAYLANPSTPAIVQSNKAELDRLIAMANAGQADVVVVGNETLYSGTLTESQLLSYIAYVKAGIAVPSVQVSTADTWNELAQQHPNVIAAVDVVLASIYPFYENVAEGGAVTQLQSDYAQLQQAAGTKPIIITETGWPSSGSPASFSPMAIPSPANQLTYFLGAEQWARQNNVSMIWFEAFSEPWKANYSDYPSWGIFDSNYVIEQPFARAFQ